MVGTDVLIKALFEHQPYSVHIRTNSHNCYRFEWRSIGFFFQHPIHDSDRNTGKAFVLHTCTDYAMEASTQPFADMIGEHALSD